MEYEIKGWPGYYFLIDENNIQVFSSWGFGPGKPRKGISRPTQIIPNKRKELSLRVSKHGYKTIGLTRELDGNRELLLHRLIAETLISNPRELECVDHINGDKANNHPSNLQWITRGDNVRKGQSMGRWGTPPKTYKIIRENGEDFIITNIREFSRQNNYNAPHLVAVSKGKRNRHKDIIGVMEILG